MKTLKSAKKTVARTTNLRYVVEIAAALGVHKTTVHSWFRGHKPSPLAANLLREKFPSLFEEITNERLDRNEVR